MRKRYKAYLHGTKEDALGYNEDRDLGFDTDSEAFKKFVYSLYEVGLLMETDTDTGETWILEVNDVPLERPVLG